MAESICFLFKNLLSKRVDAGVHTTQVFAAFDVFWHINDTCQRQTKYVDFQFTDT